MGSIIDESADVVLIKNFNVELLLPKALFIKVAPSQFKDRDLKSSGFGSIAT